MFSPVGLPWSMQWHNRMVHGVGQYAHGLVMTQVPVMLMQ